MGNATFTNSRARKKKKKEEERGYSLLCLQKNPSKFDPGEAWLSLAAPFPSPKEHHLWVSTHHV